MGRKRQKPEQILRKLRKTEVEPAKGQTTPEVGRKLGIAEQTGVLNERRAGPSRPRGPGSRGPRGSRG